MNIILLPGKLSGAVTVPPSKSMAHRMLICASLSNHPMELICPESGADIAATVACLNALGADIQPTDNGFIILPITKAQQKALLPCGESGSTLRFLLPIVGALGIDATFEMEGRLPQRPLSPLWEKMERMGCTLTRPTANTIHCIGKLRPGFYRINGSVSSQFISGLMMAMPLIEGDANLLIKGNVESMPYIEMTQYVLDWFENACPPQIEVEGDWSSAAFWLAANALGCETQVLGLNDSSPQGDRAIVGLLPRLEENITISAADIPDLVPVLAVVAAAKQGAVFTNIRRLRLKESDRVASVIAMLENLGGKAEATENTLTVYGTKLIGGTVDSFGDHRIAMAAAIAATVCAEPVTILGAECVKKSYPGFWDDYNRLA